MNNNSLKKIDWIVVCLYILLAMIGWLNIYSTTVTPENTGWFSLDYYYGKQLFFMTIGLVLIIFIFIINAKLYERLSSIYYLIFIVLLAGLFIFGNTISGATSWYAIGGFGFQPSEFAKVATILALAKYLSDIQTDIKNLRYQLGAFIIIGLPPLLTLFQPDPGTALTYGALFFVLYREGLPSLYLALPVIAALLFISTLIFGALLVSLGFLGIIIIYIYTRRRRKKKTPYTALILGSITAVLFTFSVSYIFNNVLEQRHRDRFGLWLNLEKDPQKIEQIKQTIGYNTYQSEAAIQSGKLFGKGFLEGTLTKGNFVPEQHSDYIFTSVGEEWGFVGSLVIILLYTALLLRLVFLVERQRSKFSRMYGYGLISVLFIHFFVNIGMVIGLLPTVGIPLPFLSYGGSSFLSFSLMLFIFLRLDTQKYIHA